MKKWNIKFIILSFLLITVLINPLFSIKTLSYKTRYKKLYFSSNKKYAVGTFKSRTLHYIPSNGRRRSYHSFYLKNADEFIDVKISNNGRSVVCYFAKYPPEDEGGRSSVENYTYYLARIDTKTRKIITLDKTMRYPGVISLSKHGRYTAMGMNIYISGSYRIFVFNRTGKKIASYGNHSIKGKVTKISFITFKRIKYVVDNSKTEYFNISR